MAKGGTVSRYLVWVLLVLLIVGLAGFGIGGFGGSMQRIGMVGSQPVAINDYARSLQQEMNALSAQTGRSLTFAEAQGFGVDRAVRQRLVTAAALDDLTDRIGLSVGDARLATEIRNMPAFGGVTGGFDREGYRFMLEQSGYTEARFETRVRADLARAILQRAVADGVAAPDALARLFYAHVSEERAISVVRLTEYDLPALLPDPTLEDLRAHYAANEAAYTRLEARRIAYAVLLPETMVGEVAVDDSVLRALYEARIDEYVQPERRLVERLVFRTEADAEDARNRVDGGAVTFDDLVSERGLTLSDVDLGDVSASDLGDAATTVFGADPPAVVGPLASPLGPALFRINAVLAASEVSFASARDDLVAEYALDAARRMIADRVDDVDDLLAGGATLEDLQTEIGMQVGSIDLLPGAREGLAAYPEFRQRAEAVSDRDFPEVFMLSDGGIAALRLEAVLAPELRPYDEVADAVAEDWRAATLRDALNAHAAEAAEAIAQGAPLGAFGIVDVYAALTRNGFIEGAPPVLLERAFEMQAGDLTMISEGDFVALLQLDAVMPADQNAPAAVQMKDAFASEAGQGMAADAFMLFSRAIEDSVTIRLDEGAIAAVHAQMQ